MNGIIEAPFTEEQVKRLNRFQKAYIFHPFTCGSGRRTDKAHLDGEGRLVATKDGWICPYCDYKQYWASNLMVDDFYGNGWREIEYWSLPKEGYFKVWDGHFFVATVTYEEYLQIKDKVKYWDWN